MPGSNIGNLNTQDQIRAIQHGSRISTTSTEFPASWPGPQFHAIRCQIKLAIMPRGAVSHSRSSIVVPGEIRDALRYRSPSQNRTLS